MLRAGRDDATQPERRGYSPRMGTVQVGERAGAERPTCPFCKEALAAAEARWACPLCATPHHDACALENDGCTVLGCAGKHAGAAAAHWPAVHGARPALDVVTPPPPAPATQRPVVRAGLGAAAVGAVLLLGGALLELPGPSREAAIQRAAPLLWLGLALLGLGLAAAFLAAALGQAPAANQASRQR